MNDTGTPLDAAREAATLVALVFAVYCVDLLVRTLVS